MKAVLPAALALVVACGSAGDLGSGPPPPTGTITVFAAASLTAAFQTIGADFQHEHPGVTVKFNFAGTPTLVTQIEQGAKADVFASADVSNLDKMRADGFAGIDTYVFAHNKLEIVVAPGNPKHISSVADLAKPGLIYISAGPTVPAGRYAAQALDKAGVKVKPKSLEADVKSVVSKVELGEADAGIVYTTDVKAAGDKVAGVDIPEQYNVVATYPMALVAHTSNGVTASAFIEYVLSTRGQATLEKYGFEPA